MDFDPQCNTTSGFGLRDKALESNVYLAIANGRSFEGHVLDTGHSNLSLVPSTPDLSGAEVELQEEDDKFAALKNTLKTVDGVYDVVLIDCPEC